MIRPFQHQDRESTIQILRATGNFSPTEIGIAEELLDIVLAQPGQRDYFAFVASGGDTLETQGMLIFGPVPATVGSWHLYWIAVHPDSQGTGIAAALQSFAESFVQKQGGYWILAETSSQSGYSRARAFYLKHGYRELARLPDYYKPSDDMLLYGKRLG